MAGLLFARAGCNTLVLEKHADFFRDFRGDTIHPSTLELMYELGLLAAFLELPHDEVHELSAEIGPDRLPLADFRHLPTHCKYIALMPQWDFLDFIADQARALPKFRLLLSTEATGLIEDNGRIVGITSTAGDIRAALTIAADGRHSVLREAAGLEVEDFASPMDVLWFRISRRPTDPKDTFGHAEAGRLMVLINRGTYWQIAYLIPKGGDAALRGGPIERFRADVGRVTPFLGDRVGEIAGWDQVKLLTVKVDRLARWHRPGFLAIGDAAHAMSPIGGVGVNLAVQDAVAAANRLAAPLARGSVDESVLAAIQKRREFPTKVTQGAQIAVQKRLIDPLLNTDTPIRAPWLLKLLSSIPLLRTIPAYVVGVGVRPEHIGR